MKLVHLVLQNFRGAPDGSYSFAEPGSGAPHPLVIITGGPSTGKTSLLEAIAAAKECIGGYGPAPEQASLLERGARSGSLSTTWRFSEEEAARAGLPGPTWTVEIKLGGDAFLPLCDDRVRAAFAAYSHDGDCPKFEYFPSNRRLSFRSGAVPAAAAEARTRLGAAPDKYAVVAQALVELARGEGERAVLLLRSRGVLLDAECGDALAPYRESLRGMLPHLRLRGVATQDGAPRVLFERRDGALLGIEELSGSEQQAVLFAVTFRRVGLSRSVVLVDEPELHVSSGSQARFLAAVATLGVDNQIIAATGADEVVRSTPPDQIIRLGGAEAMAGLARTGDTTACPGTTPMPVPAPPAPHVGGPLHGATPVCVQAEGRSPMRLGDFADCQYSAPDTVAAGAAMVLVCGLPAARLGEKTSHGGAISIASATIEVGGPMFCLPANVTVAGPPDFRHDTLCDLYQLSTLPSGKDLLDQLAATGQPVLIEPGSDLHNAGTVSTGGDDLFNGTGGPSRIQYNPGIAVTVNGMSEDPMPPPVALGHELCHALHAARGEYALGADPNGPPSQPGIARTEAQAIGVGSYQNEYPSENSIRHDLGLAARRDHHANEHDLATGAELTTPTGTLKRLGYCV